MRDRAAGFFRLLDWPGFLTVLALITYGVVMVQSATHGTRLAALGDRQLLYGSLAAVVLLAALAVSYEVWIDYSAFLYGLVVLTLLAMPLIGHSVAGSRSWLSLGPAGLQPSEMAKVFAALACAGYIKDMAARSLERRDVAILFAIAALPMALTAAQPDFGTATTFLPLFGAILYLSGAPLGRIVKWAGLAAVGVAVLFALGWFTFFKPYQKDRILTFLDPSIDPKGAGYQVVQARIAVGSGQVTGKGLRSGTQNRLNFLPAPHTDFIFGVVAEETGFLGSALLLSLYLGLLLRLAGTLELAKDPEGRFLVAAAFFTLLYHILINVGMVIGLLPTTGIPLPFLSYGGSALLAMTLFAALGINVRMRRFSV